MQKLVKVKAVKNFVIDGYEEYPFQRMGHAHPFEYVEVPETRVERLLNDKVIELLPEVTPDEPIVPVINHYAGVIIKHDEPVVEEPVEEEPESMEEDEEPQEEEQSEKPVRKTTRRKTKAKK